MIDRLINKYGSRVAYTKASVSVNVASQIKALRRRRDMTQEILAQEAEMKQSRISAIERPGATGLSIETLVRMASAFKVGLMVKFVPFSEMLKWENEYSQDIFDVISIDKDIQFIEPKKYSGPASNIGSIVYLKQPSCGVEEYTGVTKESNPYLIQNQQQTGDDKKIEQSNVTGLQIMQLGG
jgi:transcriptional regulator with XRE-family HTH domain